MCRSSNTYQLRSLWKSHSYVTTRYERKPVIRVNCHSGGIFKGSQHVSRKLSRNLITMQEGKNVVHWTLLSNGCRSTMDFVWSADWRFLTQGKVGMCQEFELLSSSFWIERDNKILIHLMNSIFSKSRILKLWSFKYCWTLEGPEVPYSCSNSPTFSAHYIKV